MSCNVIVDLFIELYEMGDGSRLSNFNLNASLGENRVEFAAMGRLKWS